MKNDDSITVVVKNKQTNKHPLPPPQKKEAKIQDILNKKFMKISFDHSVV